jgi:hypothetical protein
MFVFRSGVPVAVPDDYANDPYHAMLVTFLNAETRYEAVVAFLEQHSASWLAADVLTSAPWSKKFLNTTAQLWASSQTNRALAARGWRALMHVLNGTKSRTGRPRAPAMTTDVRDHTADVLTWWRSTIDNLWPERVALASAIAAVAGTRFPLSKAHRRALVALARRKGLRKHDLVLTLVSWETGVPVRRLRTTQPAAELVYR